MAAFCQQLIPHTEALKHHHIGNMTKIEQASLEFRAKQYMSDSARHHGPRLTHFRPAMSTGDGQLECTVHRDHRHPPSGSAAPQNATSLLRFNKDQRASRGMTCKWHTDQKLLFIEGKRLNLSQSLLGGTLQHSLITDCFKGQCHNSRVGSNWVFLLSNWN